MSWFTKTLNNLSIPIPSIFVETGAYLGDGIQSALEVDTYTSIHSIELSEQWVEHCKKRFYGNTRVHIHSGDSAVVLTNLNLPKEPILFYLDAHFSGGNTAGAHIDNGCPVLRELESIVNRNVKGDIIFIDDMRLMGKASWSGVQGSWIYPLTFFDFSHATDDAIRKVFTNRNIKHWAICEGFDRLLIVLD
jgi:hypothetical protein